MWTFQFSDSSWTFENTRNDLRHITLLPTLSSMPTIFFFIYIYFSPFMFLVWVVSGGASNTQKTNSFLPSLLLFFPTSFPSSPRAAGVRSLCHKSKLVKQVLQPRSEKGERVWKDWRKGTAFVLLKRQFGWSPSLGDRRSATLLLTLSPDLVSPCPWTPRTFTGLVPLRGLADADPKVCHNKWPVLSSPY